MKAEPKIHLQLLLRVTYSVLNSVDEHTILNGGEQTELHRTRILELQGAGNILKLGNNHLMKSAVISQELQLGILSNRVKTMSKKEVESELEGEPSFLTHLESKRPAEEYSPVTILPPNLWIALLFNVLEEVNENEESLTKVQLFISKMKNVNCKYHIINLFEKNLVKKILGGNETICQRKTEYDIYWQFICLFNFSFNILHNANTLEITYRKAFVNPLILKAFDDLNDKIRFQIREIESKLCKRFLEVVGNAMAEDITGYYGDMEKLFKAMQILIFYQHQHHLTCDVSEDQLPCIQSFGLLVYCM
ncbi:unnamed protein product [Rhizophagus irregularis]|nr:unnamed protein product [Rhizophagus irregularis]